MNAPDLADALERSRAALMEAIGELDEEGFRHRPESDGWNVAEVLAHLLSHEERFAWLVEQALTRENPLVESRGGDQQAEEAKRAQRMLAPQLVHGLLARRRDSLQLLEGLTEAQLARTIRHTRFGEVSTGWMFNRIVEHETEHAGQIASVRERIAASAQM